jgi:hypothetical protein
MAYSEAIKYFLVLDHYEYEMHQTEFYVYGFYRKFRLNAF